MTRSEEGSIYSSFFNFFSSINFRWFVLRCAVTLRNPWKVADVSRNKHLSHLIKLTIGFWIVFNFLRKNGGKKIKTRAISTNFIASDEEWLVRLVISVKDVLVTKNIQNARHLSNRSASASGIRMYSLVCAADAAETRCKNSRHWWLPSAYTRNASSTWLIAGMIRTIKKSCSAEDSGPEAI